MAVLLLGTGLCPVSLPLGLTSWSIVFLCTASPTRQGKGQRTGKAQEQERVYSGERGQGLWAEGLLSSLFSDTPPAWERPPCVYPCMCLWPVFLHMPSGCGPCRGAIFWCPPCWLSGVALARGWCWRVSRPWSAPWCSLPTLGAGVGDLTW